MKISDLITEGKKDLHTNEVDLLLSYLLNFDILELYLHLDETVSE